MSFEEDPAREGRAPRRRSWMGGAIAAIAVVQVLAVALFVLVFMRDRQIGSNEQAAAEALEQIHAAELDFRANDKDENGAADFWTADVAGLHGFGLVPREIAEADAAPLERRPGASRPYHGYWFRAMEIEGAPRRHASRFAFCAYPAEYGKTGKGTYVIDEARSLLRIDHGGKPLLQRPIR